MSKKKLYIIGAGLAGLTSAIEACKKGYDVKIFETLQYAGGRCRSFHDKKLGIEIDNGNHLILGANDNILKLIEELNLQDGFNKFEKPTYNFFDAKNNKTYFFKPPIPNPKYFSFLDIINFIKFISFNKKGKTIEQRLGANSNIYQKLIDPVSRSILNTDSKKADANILRNVFKEILKRKNGFNYYYPKNNWGDNLIDPMLEKLKDLGAEINFGKNFKELVNEGNKVTKIIFNDEEIEISKGDKLIIATPPIAAEKFLNESYIKSYNSIVNIHFKIEHSLSPQIIGIIKAPVEWVFVKPNLISTTFSAANTLEVNDNLVNEVWDICSAVLGLNSKTPEYRIINEKRATFECTLENLNKRPTHKTKFDNVFITGDYIQNGLPSTIEGTVMNGKKVIDLI